MSRAGGLRRGLAGRLVAACLLLAVVLAACVSSPPRSDAPSRPSPPAGDAATQSPEGPGRETAGAPRACPDLTGEPLGRPSLTARTEVLQEGGAGRLRVEAAVYPHPRYQGNPWSQWGQGVVLPDGRFLSAIGDHLGADGNSYLYGFDPRTGTLALLTDVLSRTEHRPGAWGYGKVHGQMVLGRCGEVYFATYWGSRRGLQFSPTYRGDLLFRLDPEVTSIARVGVPVPRRGIPSLAGWAEGGLLYGEAVDPAFEEDRGPFFVYDPYRGDLVFLREDPGHTGFRSVAVDGRGRAYYSIGGGALAVFDPRTREVHRHPEPLPGAWLRAATPPDAGGVVYGVTRDPDVLFALEPSGRIRSLAPARGYTASVVLDERGGRLLYIPGAHGDSWQQGTPLIAVDLRSGQESVLVRLNDLAEERLGLRLGGTYNLALDPSGKVLYVGLNAGAPGAEDAFGEVVLVVVHLR